MTHPTDAAIAQAYLDVVIDWDGSTTDPIWPGLKAILTRARELDAEKGGEKEDGPGSNTGHGHVWPRPDGGKARCGGPGLCAPCSADAARYPATPPAQAAEAVERVRRALWENRTGTYDAMARAAIAAMQAGE